MRRRLALGCKVVMVGGHLDLLHVDKLFSKEHALALEAVLHLHRLEVGMVRRVLSLRCHVRRALVELRELRFILFTNIYNKTFFT